MSRPTDVVQGTLDLLILKMLALEPMNGWDVSQRLEQEGWITAEWRQSENNRRAKFYTLTRLGRKQLDRERESWMRLSAAISMVVRLKEA